MAFGNPVGNVEAADRQMQQCRGLHVQGVAIVPAYLLRGALGYERVLSDAEVELLAPTAWSRLRPAA